MRTLKKVLALTLVMAMAFVMLAGATFTDKTAIKAVKQTNLVSALGIMKGYPDGSFKPGTAITRAEAAKMLYVIYVGSDSGSDTYKTASYFKDVPSSYWAAGYVNALKAKNVVAGTENGYEPEAQLTGLQLAKMLLIAVGYDATRSNLVGTQWAINTMNLGLSAGLFTDYTLALDAPATREAASIMFYNAIWADMVKWSNDALDYVDYGKTVGEKFFNLDQYEGTLVAVDRVQLGSPASYTEDKIMIAANDNTTDTDYVTFAGTKAFDYVTKDRSLLGQWVVVLYNTKDDKVIDLVPSGDSIVISTTLGDLSAVTTDGTLIKYNNKNYSFDLGLRVFRNYLEDLSFRAGGVAGAAIDYTKLVGTSAVANGDGTFSPAGMLVANRGDPVTLIDADGDGDIDSAGICAREFGYVASLDTKSIDFGKGAMNFLNTDGDTVVFANGVAKDDYVYFWQDKINIADYYLTKAVATVVTVDGTAFDSKSKVDTDAIVVAGTTRNKSVVKMYGQGDAVNTKPTAGDSYQLFLDGKFWLAVIPQTSIAAQGNYAFVKSALNKNPGTFTDAKVEVLLPGETDTATYTLNSSSEVKTQSGDIDLTNIATPANASYVVNKIFAYSIKADGSIELSQDLTNYTAGANIGYNQYADNFTVSGLADATKNGDYVLDASAVVFYQGATLQAFGYGDFDTTFAPTAGNLCSFVYTTSGGFKYITAAAIINGAPLTAQHGAASDAMYGFLTGYPSLVKDTVNDWNNINYFMWVNGAQKTIVQTDVGAAAIVHPQRKDFVVFTLKTDGTIKDISYAVTANADHQAGTSGDITAYNKTTGKITIAQPNYSGVYNITADTVTAYIDYDNFKGVTGSGYSAISSSDAATWDNCFYVLGTGEDAYNVLYIAIDSVTTTIKHSSLKKGSDFPA